MQDTYEIVVKIDDLYARLWLCKASAGEEPGIRTALLLSKGSDFHLTRYPDGKSHLELTQGVFTEYFSTPFNQIGFEDLIPQGTDRITCRTADYSSLHESHTTTKVRPENAIVIEVGKSLHKEFIYGVYLSRMSDETAIKRILKSNNLYPAPDGYINTCLEIHKIGLFPDLHFVFLGYS